MAHLIARIPRADAPPGAPADAFEQGCEALSRFKGVRLTDRALCASAAVAIAPAARATDKRVWRSPGGEAWLVDLGVWLPVPARRGLDGGWLLGQYLELGAERLAAHLQGLFAIVIGDERTGTVQVITDRCGSLHLFVREDPAAFWLSTSSAVLGGRGGGGLDPVALHELVATGIVFEDRSLWTGVRKVPPATVLTLGPGGRSERRYWRFGQIEAERLGTEEAADRVLDGLTRIIEALPESDLPLVSDLTGGYDSRLLLAGLLASGRRFETTVSGAAGHPDVVVSQRIASELGLSHGVVAPAGPPSAELFDAALRLTDGEYDAFDYARILRVHRGLAERYAMSLNGSFGELARGYWWELLWPRLASRRPLDAGLVARKRFAAFPYDARVFDGQARLALAEHLTEVAGRAAAEAAGLPNTSQLDAVYYRMRMQRWQGRIASATSQLWPAFSPLGFTEAIDPILSARASARFRSLLVRALLARHAPRLAQIPLEHGYPPCPATVLNLPRFAPLARHYAEKVASKIANRLGVGGQASTPEASATLTPRGAYADLFRDLPLAQWLSQPALADSGLLVPQRLIETLDPDRPRRGTALEQWRRLVTVEALLRSLPS
jgi:asparagine synthase (glutamine-hydrolysing)